MLLQAAVSFREVALKFFLGKISTNFLGKISTN